MRKKLISGILFIFLVLSISACNLSWQNINPTPFFPTPNFTMTALFSVDENLVTNTPQDFAINTQEPALPIIQPTGLATDVPIQPSPTNTTSPTVIPPANTPLPPTATSTQMTVRGGTWVSAKYLKTPPVFDSVWDEWETTKYPAKYVVYGANHWTDADDLEGSFRIGWNETYLYLAVKVLDDVYVQNATGQDIYKGDSIEILLDTNLYGDLSTTTLNSDDYQIGISPGKGSIDGEKEAFLWFPSGKAGGLDDVLIASSRSDGVYRVEIAIPWKVYGITPASGSISLRRSGRR